MNTTVDRLAGDLHEEARASDERRLLVLAGDRERGYAALESILETLPVPITGTTLVGPEDRLRCERIPQSNAGRLLGTTRDVAILDAHDQFQPNAIGSLVGTVDGGGLLVLLAPALEGWPDRRDGFDESLAVPPFSVDDVTGHFRGRLVETLRAHRGIAIVDLESDTVESDGRTRPAPRLPTERPAPPTEHRFPRAAYDACYTQDQVDALVGLESLLEPGRAVVCEADRGRGKSSALGLAAGCFVARGEDVVVTAPSRRNAREVFARAGELLETLGLDATVTDSDSGSGSGPDPAVGTSDLAVEGSLESGDGTRSDFAGERADGRAMSGSVRFCEPTDANSDGADVVLVDEAAALPVRTLTELLAADRIAFATTVHGYEGAGRGFSVRFRDHLEESAHDVADVTLVEPIRYAAGDPVETWAFHALLLDARPPVEPLVAEATPETVTYRVLSSRALLADDHLLREAFGLLVLAHYRTEPNDLARVLDAPNLEARALCHDGHVVSVCLLAREGGLSSETRAEMYEGGRIRGNMLPDVLTSQVRDERAGISRGLRVVRIATHHAVRSRGLGSHVLERVREEFTGEESGERPTGAGVENSCEDDDRRTHAGVDWLGTGFGATPELLEFWRANGYSTVHCSTTRNDASGEYSAIMLAPLTDAGRRLHDRHARWFVRRFPAVCTDSLDDLEPDVARALLRSVDAAAPELEVTPHEWRVVAGAAYGPGLFDVDPGPFRELVCRYLLDAVALEELSPREERLLVLRVLQGHDWPTVADRLAYHSPGQCMRALGDALCPLVDRYGAAALEVRERFSDDAD